MAYGTCEISAMRLTVRSSKITDDARGGTKVRHEVAMLLLEEKVWMTASLEPRA